MNRNPHDWMARVLLAAALVVAPAAALTATFAGGSVEAGKPVLIVAPAGAAAVVARSAGGQVIGPEAAPFAVLAVFDAPPPRVDLVRLGAWVVIDGRRLAAICGVTFDD